MNDDLPSVNASSEDDSKPMKYIAGICSSCKQASVRPVHVRLLNKQASRTNRLQLKCRKARCLENQDSEMLRHGELVKVKFSTTTLRNQWGFKNCVENSGIYVYNSRRECESVCHMYNLYNVRVIQ